MVRFREWLAQRRDLIGRFLFEIVIIIIGVTIAFALEAARQDREEEAYRDAMIAALIPTLDDVVLHDSRFVGETRAKLAAFDSALARGEQPKLPIYRESGSERPPIRAWDGIVATGVSRALAPDLFFELSLFYTRQESVGERYIRYADMTEQQIMPLGPDQAGIYDPATGRLKPAYAAYVDRLRDLVGIAADLEIQARELKARLLALD